MGGFLIGLGGQRLDELDWLGFISIAIYGGLCGGSQMLVAWLVLDGFHFCYNFFFPKISFIYIYVGITWSKFHLKLKKNKNKLHCFVRSNGSPLEKSKWKDQIRNKFKLKGLKCNKIETTWTKIKTYRA